MSRSIRGLIGVLAILLTLAFVVSIASFMRASPVSADIGSVERGRYLATAGPCRECHTPRLPDNPTALDLSKAFAGGEKFELPFGTIFSTNITQDKETGIGNLTDEQIKTASRDGIGKDGRKLILHPSAAFRGMADSDLNALTAFLKSLSPIKNAVPAADLKAPRDALFVPPTGAGAASVPASGKALGEYLAKSVFGCTDCHIPGALQGQPDLTKFLGSPNITPDKATGIGNWSREDIVRATREGVRPDGRRLSPIMPISTAYVNINNTDMYAVIDYLQSLTPVTLGKPGGERLYQVNCGRCHGLNGEGGFGAPLGGTAQRLQQFGITAEQALPMAIGLVRNAPPPMPSFTAAQLSDADVQAILQHLLTLPPPPAPPGPPPAAAAPAAPTTAPAPTGLPRTGDDLPAVPLVIGAALLLAAGLVLRRKSMRT